MEKVMVRSVAVRLHRVLVKQIGMSVRGQSDVYTAQQIEEAAMAWFNCFTALRFMDVNGLLDKGFCRVRDLDDNIEGLWRQIENLSEKIPYVFHCVLDLDRCLVPCCLGGRGGVVDLLVNEMAEEVWKPVQIIGWMFQYANGEKKDETFRLLKKKVKISKDRLPVATQLFTPQWIVRYLAENSLAVKVKESDSWKYRERENIQSEEVQKKLRELLEEKDLTQIRCIDPCMGSGHILTELFDLLAGCYRKQGYSAKQSAELILEYNLYGADIDPQVVELAGFSLMMKAWMLDRSAQVDRIHVHCCVSDESMVKMKDCYPEKEEEIVSLVEEMKEAEMLGALLCPGKRDYRGLSAICDNRKSREMVCSAEILSQQYDVVITNPPYLSTAGMEKKLQKYLKKHYPQTCMDLSMAMMQRSQSLAEKEGVIAMINIPVWMTLTSYQNYRKTLLENTTLLSMLLLGRGVFGSDFGTCAFVALNQRVRGYRGSYRKLYDRKSEVESLSRKEQRYFSKAQRYFQDQQDFLELPGYPVAYALTEQLKESFVRGSAVDSVASVRQGMATGNNEKYLRFWYEVPFDEIAADCTDLDEFAASHKKYVPYNKGGAYCKWYGNQDYVILFDEQARKQLAVSGNRMPSRQYYFKPCLTWSKVTIGGFSMRYLPAGSVFDVSGCSIFTDEKRSLELLGFFNSRAAARILNYFSPTVNYEVGHIKAMPVLPYMNKQTEQRIRENIGLSRQDRKQFETCREFENHPLIKEGMSLQQAWIRWQKECRDRYDRVKENERQINLRIDQFYPDSQSEKMEMPVTIHRFDEHRQGKWILSRKDAAVSLISYGIGCLLGRYSLQQDGIVNEEREEILLQLDHGEAAAEFMNWMKKAFRKENIEEELHWIAESLQGKGSDREILEHYLERQFYRDHFRMYQKHPVYWLFRSKEKNGFKALVYIHHCSGCLDELAKTADRTDPAMAQRIRNHCRKGHQLKPGKGLEWNLELFEDCMDIK